MKNRNDYILVKERTLQDLYGAMEFQKDYMLYLKVGFLLILLISSIYMINNIIFINTTKGLDRALIAEAVGEKYVGMYAVACVIRNRIAQGIPLGMKGLERSDLDEFVSRQDKASKDNARKIIKEVLYNNAVDITNGATHFENVEKYGTPVWAKGMTVTTKIGNHTFYKEIK